MGIKVSLAREEPLELDKLSELPKRCIEVATEIAKARQDKELDLKK